MADLFCTFLDFRSLATNYKLLLILPSNRYYSSPHSHSSRISRIRRRPLHLASFSPPSSPTPSFSSQIDVISTYEHPDGSLVFRFGDPSEIEKNVETEESKSVKEEIETESKDVSTMSKVVEGDNETVTAKKADTEVTASSSTVKEEIEGESQDVSAMSKVVEGEETDSSSAEVADDTDSLVSSSKTVADVVEVEGESESCEKLLEGSTDAVLTCDEETERISTPDVVDIEHIENVEEGLNEDYEDSSVVESVLDEGSKVESDIGTVALSETEMKVASAVNVKQTGYVEEGLNEEYVDSPVDSPILDRNPEMLNDISTVALSEKETGDITSNDADVEQTEEEGVDEEHEESSTENASDKSPEVENNTSILDFSDSEAGEVTSVTDENINVPDDGVLPDSLETDVTADVETEMQNEDEREGFGSNLVSQIEGENMQAAEKEKVAMNDITALNMQNVIDNGNASDISDAEANSSPPMEAAGNLSVGSEDVASGDMVELVTEHPRLEAVSAHEEDTGIGAVEESREDDGSENLITGRDLVEASVSEATVLNETEGCRSEKDGIEILTVPPQLEDDSMLEEEIDIGTVEESHEDDGSENIKGVGAIVEASEPEATTSTESSTMSHETSMTSFVLSSGADLLPHPSKVLTGGEDAYFIAGQTWLGVADGVCQWSLEGTNPGVYAQELMRNCGTLISSDNGNSINNPVELLTRSVAETHSPGSSTVLVAQFDGQALHVANIGDSGFIVVRDGVVYKRSSPMHHVFHFPIQIERGDDPSSLAEFYTVDLEEGDIIITATDGLLDNLYDQEILSVVVKSLAADKKLEEIADLLATKAQKIGNSAHVRTPFGDDAQAAGFAGYSGGKLDDVAVIVSVVQKR